MIHKIQKIIFGILGLRFIDPIEVFYLKEPNTFYPIISKSGCSSIKLAIIRKYNTEFTSSFPEIHQINPAKVTNNMVARFLFYNSKSYLNFSKGKNICLIIRDPYARSYSCYLDIFKGKNIMYNISMNLKKTDNFTFNNFISIISFIPDYLSDRHFRSQSFYFSKKIQKNINKSKILLLEHLTITDTKFIDSDIKLNSNSSVLSNKELNNLKRLSKFNIRYKSDILLYEKIKGEMSNNKPIL
jgi:hypothetical protein